MKRLVKQATSRARLDASGVAAFSGHSMPVGEARDLLKGRFDTVAIRRAGCCKAVKVPVRYLDTLSKVSVLEVRAGVWPTYAPRRMKSDAGWHFIRAQAAER